MMTYWRKWNGKDEVAGADGISQPGGARLRFPTFITVLVSLSSVTHGVHLCICVAIANWLVVSWRIHQEHLSTQCKCVHISKQHLVKELYGWIVIMYAFTIARKAVYMVQDVVLSHNSSMAGI
ncbi:hypothetical protein BU25DRAFT_411471 [Macroventuria anomochaeta]|uniref:Uncharacterized protein n=1 Tax=Macroventuria anomochaeta TaxID=301207 RepID=A0ACB6S175_9PLEO|nr:uncharacterized protein BU25DRAFT_411471 [Macroventuria anomochaeta]KAF2626949.1 hypothetical protein BU25DRAFT_411471 [Macroventuria anomochaeta]